MSQSEAARRTGAEERGDVLAEVALAGVEAAVRLEVPDRSEEGVVLGIRRRAVVVDEDGALDEPGVR